MFEALAAEGGPPNATLIDRTRVNAQRAKRGALFQAIGSNWRGRNTKSTPSRIDLVVLSPPC
ncbi:hypothetical protein D3Y57_02640 (plasmid) [Sphingomonas paeninsulae]|uniref:Uncharacterized protein n=1 Tax=Sphingomonas paeninsulae TaxID=2319844 RepID=A0A494TD21_SPHPE|nr:hypothetical protein [Sphingomonas paeninsulae]AYJ84973.1 hypothetical protein D3Y57_02640 [Sphingomonas paeninsulae]